MKITMHTRSLFVAILSLLLSFLATNNLSAEGPFVLSEAKLTASEPSAGDEFGYAVSIDGDTLVAGAPWHDATIDVQTFNNAGSSYVLEYSFDVSTSTRKIGEQTKLTATEPKPEDRFGNAVSFKGDTLVVGSYRADGVDADGKTVADAGSVYVLTRSYDEAEGKWVFTQQDKLSNTEPAPGDEFGYSVAISGDTLVVGTHRDDDAGTNSGSAYVFRYNGSDWLQESKLLATDLATDDRFGFSVAIDGDTLVVGATNDDDIGSNSGVAYVFRHNGATWVEEAKLLAGDLAAGDKFGYSVAISGDTLVVGAPWHDGGESNSGAAYIFRYSGSLWIEEAKLTASDPGADDRFGNAVSFSNKTIVVGAYKDDVLDVDTNVVADAGSAYVFRHDGTTWIEEAKLTAVDLAAGDEFGHALAISGDIVLVGAHRDDDAGTSSGSAYVFTLTPENQPPIAIAGDDQEVEEEALVTLDGSGSYDLDGDELQYQWQQNGGLEVSLDDPSKVTPTFKAPTVSAEREILTFQLVVNDGTAESEPAEVTVTVVKSAPKTSEITALLGDRNRPWGLDRDVYTFMGEQGDTVTITLQAKVGGKNNGGDRATLKLQDNMSEVRFFRINSGVLPNTISATLPATGPYLVTVAGQPRFYKGKRFLGEYTLTLEGTSGRLEAGSGSSAFANRSNPSAKPPRSHRMWNWLVNRFPGLKHHGK